MCLCSEYILFASLQMVPPRCLATGQAVGNRAPISGRIETLRNLQAAVSPRLQPGQILQALCGESPPQTENRQ